MSKGLRNLLLYTVAILIVTVGYYFYVLSAHGTSPERETFLTDIGEVIGEVAVWSFGFIYLRTFMKLTMGRGPFARRLLPDYSPPKAAGSLKKIVGYLDRTHVYVGIFALALVLIHIALMGLRADILFFPVVLGLVIWQGAFGMLLSWRGAPTDIKRWSYYVHAQLVTGVAIGLFAYFGHLLLDD